MTTPLVRYVSLPSSPLTIRPSPALKRQKDALLGAVSNTANGKEATPEKQAEVLQIVRSIETTKPPSPKLLSDPTMAKSLLDGVWYLQYTSPSQVGDDDAFPDSWKPEYAKEGESNIETRQFQAQGSVSAAGIKVDTSNKVVQQIFDVEASRVANLVTLDWGTIQVSGGFRQSPNIENRAIVSFDSVLIRWGDNGPELNISFLFSILAVVRGTKDNGWLETTYIDDSLRIGRGNEGTMFVLTRDSNAVTP